jgi:predicted Zn-dependent peptidase
MTTKFKTTELKNGLTVLTEVNSAAATVAVGFFVRTGSRDETPEISGVSHFLEHMVFKGSPRRSTADVNRELDEIGAEANAGTSEENTVFHASVLPEFQDRAVDLLGDILRPALRDDDFQTEKKVILDEIALYEDQPHFRVYDNLMGEHFRGHPLGNVILGTPKSITDLSCQAMRDYFRRRYSPGNITVVGVGRLDRDRFLGQIDALCGRWQSAPADRATPPAPPDRMRRIITDEKVQREHMGMMSAAPSAQDPSRFAATILAAIAGDSTGSRLYYALVEPAIVDEASMSYSPMDATGCFMTYLSADLDKAAKAAEIVRAEFAKLMADGPTDAELRAAKNKIASSATLKSELPLGRLSDVGFDWIYRNQYNPLSEQIERLLAVTKQEVQAVAKQYDLTSYTMLALGPMASL